jgi:hypothetical protein
VSDDSVGREVCPTLEAAHSPVGACAEPAVEAAGPEPVATEEKLEDADVVADDSASDDPRPEQWPSEAAESGARARPGEAVDCQVLPSLERPDGLPRPRSLDAVDGTPVEAAVA